MMATTAIGEDLHTVQPHGYVRTVCRCVGVGGEECEWVDVWDICPQSTVLTPSPSVPPPLHLFPVKSSSQVSQPMHVSTAATTASPKGTMYCKEGGGWRGGGGVREEGCEGGGERETERGVWGRRLTAYWDTVGQPLAKYLIPIWSGNEVSMYLPDQWFQRLFSEDKSLLFVCQNRKNCMFSVTSLLWPWDRQTGRQTDGQTDRQTPGRWTVRVRQMTSSTWVLSRGWTISSPDSCHP